nr:hypothetical protein [Tanacetum cinerariifolium]
VASRGWSFASAIPGPITHLVTSLTPDSANSCVMQVVVVAIVRVVVVVVGSSVSSINKLSLLIVGSFSCYWSSTCLGVPISIVSIYHDSSLCFQSSSNAISNQLSDASLSHNWCCGSPVMTQAGIRQLVADSIAAAFIGQERCWVVVRECWGVVWCQEVWGKSRKTRCSVWAGIMGEQCLLHSGLKGTTG